jgi:hypothetical protein
MDRFARITLAVVLAGLMLASLSCAPGPNDMERTADRDGRTAGFIKGVWHGLISPITFVISLFSRSVRFYEVHNNGAWYNFGFVLGAGLFLSGGILGRKKRRR